MIICSHKHHFGKWPTLLSYGILLYVMGVYSSSSSSVDMAEEPVVLPANTYERHTRIRWKRQDCKDGTYPHGQTCCNVCPAGEHLVQHCSNRPEDRTCVPCDIGKTFNAFPNYKTSCEPCTFCDSNAGLDTEKRCTPTTDSVCRCQQDHYCVPTDGKCRACHRCTRCASDDIKEPCTSTTDTVCNESEGVNVAAAVAIPICLLVLVVAVLLGFRNKIKALICPSVTPVPPLQEDEDVPLMDITPHLPDIAILLGLKLMRNIAIRCGMSPTEIENIMWEHRGDAAEQTFALLHALVNKEGKYALRKLIYILREKKENDKADKVIELVKRGNIP